MRKQVLEVLPVGVLEVTNVEVDHVVAVLTPLWSGLLWVLDEHRRNREQTDELHVESAIRISGEAWDGKVSDGQTLMNVESSDASTDEDHTRRGGQKLFLFTDRSAEDIPNSLLDEVIQVLERAGVVDRSGEGRAHLVG